MTKSESKCSYHNILVTASTDGCSNFSLIGDRQMPFKNTVIYNCGMCRLYERAKEVVLKETK